MTKPKLPRVPIPPPTKPHYKEMKKAIEEEEMELLDHKLKNIHSLEEADDVEMD